MCQVGVNTVKNKNRPKSVFVFKIVPYAFLTLFSLNILLYQ